MTDRPRRVSAEDSKRLERVALALAARWDCPVGGAIDRIARLSGTEAQTATALPAMLRSVVRARRRRNERLGVDLFRDPAWDMLLELLAAHHERRPLSVSALCFASGVPATTALRYVDRMVEEGLVVRSGDSADHRRVLVEIAVDRIAAIRALLGEMTASWSRARSATMS